MAIYRERIFPWLIDNVFRHDELELRRDTVIEKAIGHVLEVGSGTGANFLSYSTSITSLTTVEPNPGMNRRARSRIKYLEFPVDTREVSGSELPMKDASFDCAVTTFGLSSFSEPDRCLAEVYRVLKPGGRFLFLEHGLSDNERAAKWQRRTAKLHRAFGYGACLHQGIDVLIRDAGFSLDELSTHALRRVPSVFATIVEGVASK